MTEDEEPAAAAVTTSMQVERVIEILVGAFYDDPVWSWAFPDPLQRRDQQRQLWRLYVEGAARYPTVWLTGGGTAAAVWIPPGGTDLSPAQEAQVEPLLIALLGPCDAPRVLEAEAAFAAAHPRGEDHYYLTLLGTDPAYLGHGHGLGLLRQTLRQVDVDDMPAYLEASNTANVALYERYGFRRHSVFAVPCGGPDVTTMWRARRSEQRYRQGTPR